MIACVRLWTGQDGQSHVEHGRLALVAGAPTVPVDAVGVSFEESPPGSTLEWHTAPHRQFVITLSGTLQFTTRDGESFVLDPATVLLAEDTAGSGHTWRLGDDAPWRRVYVELGDEPVPFERDPR